MGAGADTHQGEGTPDEADLGELSNNPSDSPLPVSCTNQRELFEKHRHLWPGIRIKAPTCLVLAAMLWGDQCSDDKHTNLTCKIPVSGITNEKNDLAYIFNVTDHSEVEAPVEEASQEIPAEEFGKKVVSKETAILPGEEKKSEPSPGTSMSSLTSLFIIIMGLILTGQKIQTDPLATEYAGSHCPDMYVVSSQAPPAWSGSSQSGVTHNLNIEQTWTFHNHGKNPPTKLGSDKSDPRALIPSRIMSSDMLVGHALGLDGEVDAADHNNVMFDVPCGGTNTQAVRSLKDCLKRDGVKKITQEIMDKLTFNINGHPQDGDVGTAAERFFGRAPRSLLPNSLKRFVDHHKLIINRRDKQAEIALKKGRSCPNDFEIGDRCVVQDVLNKRWKIQGTIKEKRTSEDGSHRSFIVEKDDGTEILRNARFLKHQWRDPRPGHITWADQQ